MSGLRIMGKTSIFPMVDGLIISILNELAHVLNDHGDMMPRKDNGQMGTSRIQHKSELNFGVSSQ